MTTGAQAAYAACRRAARAHYENFPVASVLLPRGIRHHVAAVYAFARTADDFADEGVLPSGERLRLLDQWLLRLQRAVRGERPPSAIPGEPAEADQIFVALAATITACDLPLEPFEALLSAFRQDVTVTRYAEWLDLLDYCRRSANPVGRLVLRIAGYRDRQLDAWSDAICTALQLTNFWQDLAIDFHRGRVYLPQSELATRGAQECDLVATPLPSAAAAALDGAVSRTRRLFDEGRPLCDAVHGRLRFELRATWLGGTRILDRLESRPSAVASARPTLSLGNIPWLAWRMVAWNPR